MDLPATFSAGKSPAGAKYRSESVGIEVGFRAMNAAEESPCGGKMSVASVRGQQGVEGVDISKRRFIKQVVGVEAIEIAFGGKVEGMYRTS